MSRGKFSSSHVDKPTVIPVSLWDGKFRKPATVQVINIPLDEMLSVSESLTSRIFGPRGSVDVEFKLATPTARPFWCKHLACSSAAKLWKKTPLSDMTLMEPLGSALGGFGETKDKVKMTLSSLLI